MVAGIAMRRLRTKAARAALARAGRAARHARIPALTAEVESALLVLNTPAARLIAKGEERLLLLEEVEALLASNAFVVDACRHVVRHAGTVVSLARRPVLFALARALGEAWPGDVPRDTLVARAFGAKLADESHRARLRVEARAASRGAQDAGRRERDEARVCAERRAAHARSLCWHGPSKTSMRRCSPSLPTASRGRARRLALALGTSQRTVQRALDSLAAAGKVQSFGRGRARRWVTPPVAGIHDDLVTPRSSAD